MPQKARKGHAIPSLLDAGLDSIQGYLDGKPAACGTAHIDPYNAFIGLTAALAALRHRDRTGQGQHIDLAQWEATATM